jgi:hypothetical protein
MTGPIALEQFGSPRPEDDGVPGRMGTPSGAPDGSDAADAPETAIDPAAEQAACLARISGTLEIIASEQAGLRARCIGDATAALGAAGGTLLPRLARTGFATLVAETALTIARRGQWPELLLTVAPINAAVITSALGACRPDTGVKLTVDPELGPGEVEIAWSQGGAEIDVEAIAEAALERFRMQLGRCAQQGAPE